jgi:hypothetical protein
MVKNMGFSRLIIAPLSGKVITEAKPKRMGWVGSKTLLFSASRV